MVTAQEYVLRSRYVYKTNVDATSRWCPPVGLLWTPNLLSPIERAGRER